MDFKLVSSYQPAGDQSEAIEKLTAGTKAGKRDQVLLGVTGSGKSLSYNEPILVIEKIKGERKPKILPIGQLIDNLFSKHKVDKQEAFEILPSNRITEKYQVISFNPKTGKQEIKTVTQFTRHPPDLDNYKVITTCGREIEVTGDHNFWILRNGTFNLVKTNEITTSDYLPVPTRLSLENTRGEIDEVRLNDSILEDCYFNISDNFLQFLGFYIAEGHGEIKYLLVSVHEKSLQQIFIKCSNELKIVIQERNRNPGDFQINNSLLAEVIAEWCGGRAREKVFPPWVMELSNRQVAILLSAYFSGDGSVNSNEITVLSASRALISGLSYILLRFGIKVRIRRKFKRATNSLMEKRESFEAVISGQEDLKSFADNIGFILPRKQQKLKEIIKKKPNTNVDIIPVDGTMLTCLRNNLGLSQKDIAIMVGCGRSYISLIENGLRFPSRKIMGKLIRAIEEKNKNREVFQNLNLLKSLTKLFWTKVKEIREIEPSSPSVYDVSVEGNETFLAGWGGLFVHNTFTVANVIQNVQKPALVISHNKTLAAQLYQEFKEFFPENAVSYFVSYYDYYQPEAYIPQTDTYIPKDADVNQEIDRLRLLATSHIFSRRDVIVVASVSCIYNLGSPESYQNRILAIKVGDQVKREDFIYSLVNLYYQRSRLEFSRGFFRTRGESVEIYPSYSNEIIKITWDQRVIKSISSRLVFADREKELTAYFLYPAKHFLADKQVIDKAFKQIGADLQARLKRLTKEGKDLEANRLEQRVNYDLEMIKEIGYVNGIENYSRYFDGRQPGDPPFSLVDYFHYQYGTDFLLVVDESHMTVPQIRGMYHGDSSRKKTLIDFGFRLPSCLDNRPLNFREFQARMGQTIFVSATPADWEIELAQRGGREGVVEQLVRPTGLVDPAVEVRPAKGQVQDLIKEILKRQERKERVLVTTLTKRTAEELSSYLDDPSNTGGAIKVQYLHADVNTLERSDILADLRGGRYDVLVGINLLREGLDLPEVSLVAILDADKQGFLRSKVSLVQTMGRAARNAAGQVILYADEMTTAMQKALEEVNRRRQVQIKYNQEHNLVPRTISKPIRERIVAKEEPADEASQSLEDLTPGEARHLVAKLKKQMRQSAKLLDFEKAVRLRDKIGRVISQFDLE